MSSLRVLVLGSVFMIVGRADAARHPGPCSVTLVDTRSGYQSVTNHHYDAAGLLTSSDYTYGGALYETRHSYDANGRKTRVASYTDGVLTGYTDSTWDAAGNETAIEVGGAAGTIYSRTTRAFDASNRMVSETRDEPVRGVMTRQVETTHEYSPDGTLHAIVRTYVSSGMATRTLHEYDAQLRLARTVTTRSLDARVDTMVYTRDAAGRVLQEDFASGLNGVIDRRIVDTHEYDAAGNQTMNDHVVDGLLINRDRSSYDTDGNLLMLTREGLTGVVATVTYSYACF